MQVYQDQDALHPRSNDHPRCKAMIATLHKKQGAPAPPLVQGDALRIRDRRSRNS